MILTQIGICIIIVFTIIFLFFNDRYIFYGIVIFSPFVATSVVKLPNMQLAIQPGHFIGILFILKVLINIMKGKYKNNIVINKNLLIFIMICGISLLYPFIFSSGTVVLNPNDKYEPIIKGNTQSFTQYFYLIFGYLCYLCTYKFLINSNIGEKKIVWILRASLLLIIILGYLQLYVPVDIYNDILRNDYHHNDQMINGIVRISSVAIEPSMLSLFTTPLVVFFSYTAILFKKTRVIDTLLVLGTIGIAILNQSSSFYVGIAILIGFNVILNIIKFFKGINIKKVIIGSFSISSILLVMYIKLDLFMRFFEPMIKKLNGEGFSGSERTYAMKYHLGICKEYFFTGVGFGNVRSYDLLSTWLSEIGIIGFITFSLFIIKLCIDLCKNNSDILKNIMSRVIVTAIGILFISVPEPYYIYLWINFAICSYLLHNDFIKKRNNGVDNNLDYRRINE